MVFLLNKCCGFNSVKPHWYYEHILLKSPHSLQLPFFLMGCSVPAAVRNSVVWVGFWWCVEGGSQCNQCLYAVILEKAITAWLEHFPHSALIGQTELTVLPAYSHTAITSTQHPSNQNMLETLSIVHYNKKNCCSVQYSTFQFTYIYIMFVHLADTFIQSDWHCFQLQIFS